jgi:hypothetical protein
MPKLAGLGRNAWQFTPGTGGSFPPERVANLARNTHDNIYIADTGQ